MYIDAGVRHTRRARHGHRTVTIHYYTPNVTLKHAAESVTLSAKGLSAHTHTVKVVVTYTEQIKRPGHGTRTVTVTRTVRGSFRVC